MSCVRGNCEHKEHWDDTQKQERITQARNAVILAAKAWGEASQWGCDDQKNALAEALNRLEELETQPDPLGPVRERYCMTKDRCSCAPAGEDLLYDIAKALLKALGMDK